MTPDPADRPPEQPMTLNDSAVGAHEVYQSLKRAGFNRWAALWLTACILKAVPLPDWFAARLEQAGEDPPS